MLPQPRRAKAAPWEQQACLHGSQRCGREGGGPGGAVTSQAGPAARRTASPLVSAAAGLWK
jgi:hypothetical protein